MERHAGTLNAYHSMEDASLKRLHARTAAIGHSRKGRTMETVEGSGVAGREGWVGGARVFRAGKLLCRILEWLMGAIHWPRPTERTRARVVLSGNHGLGGIVTCRCRRMRVQRW